MEGAHLHVESYSFLARAKTRVWEDDGNVAAYDGQKASF